MTLAMEPVAPPDAARVAEAGRGDRTMSGGASTAASTMTIVFAGGGSGGHISPGLAIAERLQEAAGEMGVQAKALFACSTRAIDRTMLAQAGVSFRAMSAAPASMNPIKAVKFFLAFRKGRAEAEAMLRESGASLVVAMGGFVTGPVVAAANRLGIPVLLVNLDATPGKANRWIAKRSARVISAMPTPKFPGFASKQVGFPLRKGAVTRLSREACREALGLDRERPVLLVTGASQGATSLNRLLAHLASTETSLFHEWQVLHLAGAGGDAPLRETYAASKVAAKVEPFLHEMSLAWGAADLAISRAGANSVAEAAANGVPTFFFPYPYHRDLHQKWNAQPLADSGGAFIVLDQIDAAKNAKAVLPMLRSLMNDPAKRGMMREAIRRHAAPDAAREIAGIAVGMVAGG
jgi:UDP-N-acetylglucosamine--N-acetylmuramyl-(pentapeptide) pyrophosphoryl-undecaprenol N-acetylglucosamine transferase